MPILHPSLELPTGRARLEPLAERHASTLFESLRDPAVWRFGPFAPPADVASMRAYIASAHASARDGSQMPFAIVDRSTGTAIGTTRYGDILPAHRQLEIGWTMVGVPWQRTSVNTECKYLLLRHAFEDLDFANGLPKGAVRMQLKCDARNERSQQAILRIGAVFEGRLRKHRIMPDGFVRDSMLYSITAEEWPAVKARLESMLTRR